MMRVRYRLPNFTIQDAERFANERYGLRAAASALPSERDQNFYLISESGEEFVLKIANVSEHRKVLELQNEAMAHLAVHASSLAIPRLCLTKSGDSISVIESSQQERHFLRMLTYIPGKLLAKVRPHTPQLMRSLGQVLGTLDHALQSFEHPAAHRDLKWDLSKAAWIHEYLPLITDPSRRKIVDDLLNQYEQHVLPVFSKLRKSIIYNDANDYNILVGGDPRRPEVIGVIDFGDLLFTQTLSELAVGAAYAMLGKVDPLSAASHIVAGYHETFPLSEAEMEALYPLICLRLCVSVTNSAYQRNAEPANEYLTISEAPAWRLLEQLKAIHPRLAHYVFRDACRTAPCPNTDRVTEWLKRNTTKLGPIVAPDLSSNKKVIFDLSVGSLELGNLTDVADASSLTRNLFEQMDHAEASVGVGQYDEVRGINTSDEFRVEGNDGPLWRTVHLGLDLFQKPGSPVFASLDGMVHSFHNNAGSHDYGPTIILQHTIEEGLDFFILYGHLSQDSLSELHEGKPVKKGDQIGKIGSMEENGGWPPHVHFQIITDLLDKKGDFPGVALPDQRNVWLSLCPDPNLIARIPEDSFPKPAIRSEEILRMRSLHLGNSLSISYEKPLHIVRGSMQYLYDENGRAYLDAVNNVPHVGHCHPRVVEAAQRQMAVLNTNTRYLHENLVEFADRLCSTLPEPLRVCYFVNSGSEANELALRMARAHTKAKDMIVLEAAYHGNTSTLIEISPYKFDGPGGSGAPPYVHKAKLPDVYRGQFKKNDPQAAKKYADEIAEQIDRIRKEGSKFCGFICESVLSCAGQVVLPDHYLEEAYHHVRKAGGVCIADEVQVGFGRVGSHFWAFETQNVIPDIVTLGKPIGNGHPLGAVVTTPEIAASFSNGMEFFSTFGGNPVSCAVGLAVLDVMKTENLQSNALQTGVYLLQGLTALKNKYPLVGDARGLGLFVGIELVLDPDRLTPAPEQASYIANRMKECGILLSSDGPYHNVLKMKPPMVFTKTNADFLLQTLDQILQEDFLNT
jgi:4-aminobutyrate aminotransferase-like enzyme/Ser/Thr protein kinase RdoA (MazF antagonist)